MKFAITTDKPFRLWIDNAEVVRHLTVWLKQPTPVAHQTTDNDLWSEAAEWIRRTAHMCHGIIKVASHQTHDDASEAEIWSFMGNEAADTLAAAAIHEHPALIFSENWLRSMSPFKHSNSLFIPPSLRWETKPSMHYITERTRRDRRNLSKMQPNHCRCQQNGLLLSIVTEHTDNIRSPFGRKSIDG